MHTVDDITEIFRAPMSNTPGCSNDYSDVYNKLLSGLFKESCFLVTFPKQNCMEDGAAGVIAVAEDVKKMCKLVGMKLKLRK